MSRFQPVKLPVTHPDFKHINLKDPFILHDPAKTDHLQNLPPLQLGFHGQAGLSLLFEASEGSLHRYARCYVE